MSTDYNYDENGQFFPYFVATMLGLVLVPMTYSTFAPSKQGGLKNHPKIESDFKPPNHTLIEQHKRKKRKESRRIKRFLFIVLGWALAGYMIYLILTTEVLGTKIWDPYDILGISTGVDERKIKSHYRKLSIKMHPDKVKLEGNQTMEWANERWVEITKAYKALTDEDIRKNYEEYGHPDGKQSFSIGIALPVWTVAEGSRYYVLAFYGMMFGIVLPYFVGKWWYGTKALTKDGVPVDVAGRLFKAFDEDIDVEDLVDILSVGGMEKFKKTMNKHEGKEHIIEKAIQEDISPRQMKNLMAMDDWRRKTAGLLWAYLNRRQLSDPKLDAEKLDVANDAVNWNNTVHSTTLAYSMTKPMLSSMKINQCLVQAIPPRGSPLLQLPFFTEELIHHIQEGETRQHWSLNKFMSLPENKRKELCVGDGRLTQEQYDTAMEIARKIPILKVDKAFFKVQGEKYITPNAIVQLVVKARVVPAGATPPPASAEDLLDEDADEDDVNALIGRDTKKRKRSLSNVDKNSIPSNEVEKSALVRGNTAPTPTLAHAPHFPAPYLPRWHIFLSDARTGRVIISPTTFTQLPNRTDDYSMQTLKLQFGAPPSAGEIPFVMHLVCDGYVGTDIKMNVRLHVDPPSVLAIQEEDEISEPDEDSIAGTMQALKTGQTPKPKKKKVDESDSDESNTEGEEEDSGSATDTDTDEE